MKSNSKVIFLFLFISCILASCKRLVDVPAPLTSLSSSNVYSTDATAIAAVTGIYSSISNGPTYSAQLQGMSGLGGLSADELTLYSTTASPALTMYYQNDLSNNVGTDFWTSVYPIIYMVNAAIEGLNNSTTLTVAVRQQLLGEAQFDRAFCYFYLVNLYGDVPLVLSTNYSANATLPRTPATQIWAQIIQDLHEASALLSPNYLDGTLLVNTSERIRPTQSAAFALLARSYLYTGNWAGADSAASVVINNSQYSLVTNPDSVFLENSSEAIWQLQPVTANGFDTQDALAFILPLTGPNTYTNFAYLNDSLVNAFETNDLRRADWIDSVSVSGVVYYYPYKYQNATLNAPITEYTMVLRLAEQYLIRAESEANAAGSGITAAVADLNVIRKRANLMPYAGGLDQMSVLNAIYHERRVELFTEWGHRWLDLKRTGTADIVMGADGACAAKGGIWKTTAQWYPIPLTELQTDPNLVQNAGY
jgi:starch-binding outer membrane protein, SusD/RagB family